MGKNGTVCHNLLSDSIVLSFRQAHINDLIDFVVETALVGLQVLGRALALLLRLVAIFGDKALALAPKQNSVGVSTLAAVAGLVTI